MLDTLWQDVRYSGARGIDVTRLLLTHVGRMAIIGGTAATVVLVILAAALIPTRRDTRVNPLIALRAES